MRTLSELLVQPERTDPFVGVNVLDALLLETRPEVDQDRFTSWLVLPDLELDDVDGAFLLRGDLEGQPRTLAELLVPSDRTEPFIGAHVLDALLFRPRPPLDQDRFTSGLVMADYVLDDFDGAFLRDDLDGADLLGG